MKFYVHLKKTGRVLGIVILAIILIAALFYLPTEIFNFEESEPFSGNTLYNPYKDYNPEKSIKANFHAHSENWGGVTNGDNSPEEVLAKYHDAGYDLATLTNYMKIFDHNSPLFIPAYEHGINIQKSHFIVLFAEDVLPFDFPIFHTKHHQQTMINKLKARGAVVSVAHPKFCMSYRPETFKYIGGYDFIEVLNHYSLSDIHWDTCLSAGRLAFLLAGDDTHDINGKNNTLVCRNEICSEPRLDSIMLNLKRGNNLGYKTSGPETFNRLISCSTEDMKISIKTEVPADSIHLIGQNGTVKSAFYATDQAEYNFKSEDTYIRAEIFTADERIFLNPVIRYDGKTLPMASQIHPEIDYVSTWLVRTAIFVSVFGMAYLVYFRKQSCPA